MYIIHGIDWYFGGKLREFAVISNNNYPYNYDKIAKNNRIL
jgi:hypothetical protein